MSASSGQPAPGGGAPDDRGLPTDGLAARVRGGNRDAEGYAELYRRVAPAIYAWASLHIRAPLRTRLDPEDLLQEVACRAYERFDTWDEQRGSFRGWVFGIARNVLLHAFERLAVETRGHAGASPGVVVAAGRGSGALLTTERFAVLPDTATSITRAVARSELLQHFVARIERLPDDERRLLMLRGLEGLSHERVSELLASTPDAVAKRWQRLRDRLRDERQWDEFLAA